MIRARKRSMGSLIGALALLNVLFAAWTFGDLRADEAEVGCWKPEVKCECFGSGGGGQCQENVIIPGEPCEMHADCW